MFFLLPGVGYADESLQEIPPLTVFPSVFDTMEDLLVFIGIAKFSEAFYASNQLSIIRAREIKELYVPGAVLQDFTLSRILVPFNVGAKPLSFIYSREEADIYDLDFIYFRGEEEVSFAWYFREQIDEETLHLRGPSSIQSPDSAYVFSWGQHWYAFRVTVPGSLIDFRSFCIEEFGDFFTAVPVIAWEIQGNPISVSIQGMENIYIFDAKGNEIINEIITGDSVLMRIISNWETYGLYRSNNDGTKDRIGYRLLVDRDLHRYQYLLEPGNYTFHAEGIIDEQELLVKHFVDHEVVSVIDYTEKFAEQLVNRFVLTIDSVPTEQTLRLEQSLRRLILTLDSPIITDLVHGTTLTMDVQPLLQEGRTLIPVRFVAEKLGASIKWDEVTQTVTIILDDQEISLVIGEATDGMDVPAQIIDGSTMVPLRFVAERLDAVVNWDPDTRTIEVIR